MKKKKKKGKKEMLSFVIKWMILLEGIKEKVRKRKTNTI